MSRTALDRLEPLPIDYTRASQRGEDRYHGTGPVDKTAKILEVSERNLEDLQELHEMMLDEKDYDYGAVAAPKRRPFEHLDVDAMSKSRTAGPVELAKEIPPPTAAFAAATSREKVNTEKLNISDSHDLLFPTQTKSPETKKSDAERKIDDDRLSALAHENDRLKKEIGSFDSEFFEQLEDLKYRYSRLQEIVGEDPSATAARKGSALPLDRLSWSVRNSMTAMDRAGLTSPLVSRPRYPTSHTYAPGGTAREGVASLGASSSFVGGTLNASQQRRTAANSNLDIHGGLTRPMYKSGMVDDFTRQPPNGKSIHP